MNQLAQILETITAGLVGLPLAALSWLSPDWALVAISAIIGVIFLFLYGGLSNQDAIRRTKRRIHGLVLESVLFRNDIRTCLGAQAGMLGAGAKYFLIAVPPILVLAIPCVLVLAQLNLRYSSRGLRPGESAVVKLRLEEPALIESVALEVPEGVQVTPPVRIPSLGEVGWRVQPLVEGDHHVTVKVGESVVRIPLRMGERLGPVETEIPGSALQALLYPRGEVSIVREARFEDISISYPSRENRLFGMELHWLATFALVSIASGLVGSRVFGVEV